nr:hypothetical protein [Tanacetum cinerariifolium]
MEHARKQQVPKETTTISNTIALAEFDQKTTLFETVTKSKSFNKSPKQRALYHALMESILEDEDAMDEVLKVLVLLVEICPTAGTEVPAALTSLMLLSEKASNSALKFLYLVDNSTKLFPLVSLLKPKRPPTPDPEWNKGKSVENKPTQKWLSDLAKAGKPSITFNDLMSTPIDFSAFVMNLLQISEFTQDILVGPAYDILKGICRSYVQLDYNMEDYYKALTDQLDWNNPKGDRYSFDLGKPIPLVMSRNRQIVLVDYFFNNDLAYLQGGSTGRTYMTSLTKTKAAKYDLLGIKDMNRLFNLKGDVIVHLAAALRMFTRCIIIKKRVEDLQLGGESY